MSVANLSGDRVADRLGVLEEAYAPFPVNQTTLAVSPAAYERVRERCSKGLADVYVKVYDEADNVLLTERDDDWAVPHVEPSVEEHLETGTRRRLVEQTGVETALTDVERATILGIRQEGDPDRNPVYRLIAVFTAEYIRGRPVDGVAWQADLPETARPSH
jgi:ADP-ribose pyrophosphatase YjhB (NUDIX family)